MTPGARRWPLHPPPGPGEALTSWLDRLAALYGMPASHLLRRALGDAAALLDDPRASDLDFDPPAEILHALAERTGIDPGVMRLTTIAGWVPWLADTLDPTEAQDAFHTYVRQDSVLLAPGEAGRSTVPHWLPWMPVRDQQWRTDFRACPACAAAPDRGTSLLAALPIMTTCGEHGCRLEPEMTVRLAAIDRDRAPSRPVPEPVAAMDRLTYEGLATGMVTLPRRAVHVGVWLRLLRTLLDEVSMAESRVGARSAAALARVWDAAGRPARAGLNVWRPYERLDPQHQQAMLEAAACALDLIRAGTITPRGTRGHLLTIQPAEEVCEGDRPSPAEEARAVIHETLRRSGEQAQRDAEVWFHSARTDPHVARQILGILTRYSRTREDFDLERRLMIVHGIPASFLPEWPTMHHPALDDPGSPVR